jgi:hypothetical protein
VRRARPTWQWLPQPRNQRSRRYNAAHAKRPRRTPSAMPRHVLVILRSSPNVRRSRAPFEKPHPPPRRHMLGLPTAEPAPAAQTVEWLTVERSCHSATRRHFGRLQKSSGYIRSLNRNGSSLDNSRHYQAVHQPVNHVSTVGQRSGMRAVDQIAASPRRASKAGVTLSCGGLSSHVERVKADSREVMGGVRAVPHTPWSRPAG